MNYDSLKLQNQLCFPLYLCSKEIIRKYTPHLNKLDLTYTQYIVMLYLWEKGKCNVSDICDTLLLETSTLTPLLKKLETKGYITRAKDEKDERSLQIELTNKGNNLKEKALFIPVEMGKCINLSEEEALSLYKILYKVLSNIEKKGE